MKHYCVVVSHQEFIVLYCVLKAWKQQAFFAHYSVLKISTLSECHHGKLSLFNVQVVPLNFFY